MKKLNSAAILTIKDASNMSEKGRKEIVDWLRLHARYLLMYGKKYSGTFRARFLYK